VVQIIQFSCILSWATFRDLLKSQVGRALPPAGEFLETGGKNMSIFAWIILGLLAGFIGSKLVNKSGEGLFLDIILGVVGAVVGGWLFNRFGAVGVTGLNLYSLLVAVVGAVVVLVVYHALRRAV
jgi:uncharacterized membrane protein YeaQ/YmgE (transglycosylase-associated protein family)